MAATTYEPWGSPGWALGPGLERIKESLEGDTYPSALRGSSRLCRLCEGVRGGVLRLSQSVRSLGRALFSLHSPVPGCLAASGAGPGLLWAAGGKGSLETFR